MATRTVDTITMARRLRRATLVAAAAIGSAFASTSAASAACAPAPGQLGVHRVVEIDATGGPLFGDITKYARETELLQPGEVVLTFDDGPMPWITRAILDALDKQCTRATFFSVGRMAIAYPETVREILGRGHTLGTHTWSHPLNLKKLPAEKAIAEIERGFAAIAAAAQEPIAPFFRFPGLNDNAALLTHLQSRGVATFTVDVVSNDSYIADADRLLRETLAKTEGKRGGILLFHDIKASTAKMLPTLLVELQRRGFKVVHLVSKHAFKPDTQLYAEHVRFLASKAAQNRKAPQSLFAAARAHAGVDDKLGVHVPTEPAGQSLTEARQSLPAATLVTSLAPRAQAFTEGGRARAERVAAQAPKKPTGAPAKADPRAQVLALANRGAATARRNARQGPQPAAQPTFWQPSGGAAWSWATTVSAGR